MKTENIQQDNGIESKENWVGNAAFKSPIVDPAEKEGKDSIFMSLIFGISVSLFYFHS